MTLGTQLTRRRPFCSSLTTQTVNHVSSIPTRPLLSFKLAAAHPLFTTPSILTSKARRGPSSVIPRAQRKQDPEVVQARKDDATILGTAFTLTALVLLALRFGGNTMSEIDAFEWIGLNSGDLLGALFWSISLYFASPWQLLLLFLGKVETDRPSDWILRRMGEAARLNLAASPLRRFLDASLGDGTWAVSSGIGSLFGAGLYEVGRPERLSVDEAKILESQWQDFKGFADDALIMKGRCHESEIFKAFRARFGRYRTQEALNDIRLRDMVRNWHRGAERSRSGWYKNVSLRSSQPAARAELPESERLPAGYSSGNSGSESETEDSSVRMVSNTSEDDESTGTGSLLDAL
ncbi:hypothetical protein Ndes2437A_g09169 [Nannochloris sp. 'desiccata']